MTIYRLLAELRAELRAYVRSRTASLAKFAAYTRSTADGATDKIAGFRVDSSDGKPYDYDGRRVWPFGIRSVPPKGVDGIWIAVTGGAGNGAIIGAESSRFGPSDLADGEVMLYNKVNGVGVRLGANGSAKMTDKGGASADLDGTGKVTLTDKAGSSAVLDGTGNAKITATAIVLNNGALGVARQTDTVTGTAGPYPLSGAVIATASTTVKAG